MFVIYTGLVFVISFLIRSIIYFKFRFLWGGGFEVTGNLPHFSSIHPYPHLGKGHFSMPENGASLNMFEMSYFPLSF